jgi:L-alanine-DL-glutamate epimerase-like enolase superfamily enzyme
MHLMMAVNNVDLLEINMSCNAVYHEFFVEPLKIENGFAFPSDRPGLGVELDYKILDA